MKSCSISVVQRSWHIWHKDTQHKWFENPARNPADRTFYIALRATVEESSKGIGSPAYYCVRFAARLTFGLINAYVLNPTQFVTLLTICSLRDHNQVLLRGWRFSKCCLPILLTFLSQPIFCASIRSLQKHILRSNCHLRLTSGALYYRALREILLSSPDHFVDQYIAERKENMLRRLSLITAFWICLVYPVAILLEILT